MSLNERQISDREIKALQIAAKHKLTRKGNVWFVPSQAGHGEYQVRADPQAPRCNSHVSLLRAQSCGVSTALPQTLKCRDHVPHDQVEVWSTVEKSDTDGADQRGSV